MIFVPLHPPACVACKGDGTLLFPTCDHAGQNCPCGEGEECICERCDGTGREPIVLAAARMRAVA